MTLSFDLPTELEVRLRQEAARAGVDPGEYVRRVVAHHLAGSDSAKGSVAALFERWQNEDPPVDAAELARRQEEFERFKQAMNRNRTESEGPDGRKPYP